MFICFYAVMNNIIRKLKGKSAQLHKKQRNFSEPFHLWGQKYNWSQIIDDNMLTNAYEYVKHNRLKHKLSINEELEKIIEEMLSPYSEAM